MSLEVWLDVRYVSSTVEKIRHSTELVHLKAQEIDEQGFHALAEVAQSVGERIEKLYLSWHQDFGYHEMKELEPEYLPNLRFLHAKRLRLSCEWLQHCRIRGVHLVECWIDHCPEQLEIGTEEISLLSLIELMDCNLDADSDWTFGNLSKLESFNWTVDEDRFEREPVSINFDSCQELTCLSVASPGTGEVRLQGGFPLLEYFHVENGEYGDHRVFCEIRKAESSNYAANLLSTTSPETSSSAISVQRLVDGDERLNTSAVPVLWEALDKACQDYDQLVEEIPDEDMRARIASDPREPLIQAFFRFHDVSTAESLLNMMREGRPAHQQAAFNGLVAIGPACFPLVKAHLPQATGAARSQLLQVLVSMGLPEALELVLETAGKKEVLTRLWKTHRQVVFQPDHPAKRGLKIVDWAFVERFLDLAEDNDPHVRSKLAILLGETRDSRAIPYIIEFSRDAPFIVQTSVIDACRLLADPAVIPALRNCLDHYQAPRALAMFGDAAVKELQQALNDPDLDIATGAIKALKRIQTHLST